MFFAIVVTTAPNRSTPKPSFTIKKLSVPLHPANNHTSLHIYAQEMTIRKMCAK